MVLVSHTHAFVFLKTRKTAGTSVEMLLEPFCAPPGHRVQERTPAIISKYGIVGRRLTPRRRMGPFRWNRTDWHNHMQAAAVAKGLGATRWGRYAKVATVRNPFDRMVSQFHYRRRKKGLHDAPFSEIRREFRTFVNQGNWPDDQDTVHYQGRLVLDYSVRFEHLQADLDALFRALGLPGNATGLPVTKSTGDSRKRFDVADYFDPDTADVVRRRMAWVFENFDYPAEPGAMPREREHAT